MKKRGRAIVAILSAALVFTAISGILPAFGAATQKEAISAETQYAAAGRSMLYIRCFYESGGLKTTGSGFIIDSDGLAVTAAHVIDKAARVTATDPSGKETECTVISCDTASDVAILRLPRGSYKALKLSEKEESGGAVLRAMGYPIKDTLVITEGLLSSPSGTVNEKQRMLVSCDILNGMSGGPIFDRYGKVVGVCSGSVRTMNGIHLSVLWSDLCTAVSAAKSGK